MFTVFFNNTHCVYYQIRKRYRYAYTNKHIHKGYSRYVILILCNCRTVIGRNPGASLGIKPSRRTGRAAGQMTGSGEPENGVGRVLHPILRTKLDTHYI